MKILSKLSKNEPYFGLDIGTTGVRLVELESKPTGFPNLRSLAHTPLEKPLITSDSPQDIDTLSKTIEELVSNTNTQSKNVAVSIPTKDAFITTVELPKMNEDELEKSLELQADQYIPMSIDDVKLDWQVVGQKDDKQQVVLVAAPNKTVEKYASIVQKAGLNLHALEIDAIATTRALAANADTAVVIIAIGDRTSDVIVVVHGVPILVRSVNIGGSTLVRSIKQNLDIDEDQAQKFLVKFGATQTKLEGQVLKAMQAPLDDLVNEVEKSLKFFKTQQYPELEIEKLVMTGRTVSVPELPLYFANSVNKKVEIANSWSYVSYPATKQDDLASYSLEFTVAIGLALRSLL